MKFICVILFAVLVACARVSPREALVRKITNKFVSENRDLLCVGSGSAMPDKIEKFMLYFYSMEKLSIPEARILYVTKVESLLQKINNNEAIRPDLVNWPFTFDNLEFRISFYENPDIRWGVPNVSKVSLINGKIHYSFYDNEQDRYLDKETVSEPYEEALRIVREQGL